MTAREGLSDGIEGISFFARGLQTNRPIPTITIAIKKGPNSFFKPNVGAISFEGSGFLISDFESLLVFLKSTIKSAIPW